MKRLYLSDTDKKFAGVCGGIAEYLEVDPTVARLLVVVLDLLTGIVPGLFVYLVAWMIMPRKPAS
ncbi:MAG TPA: PspC domain-containing protein [Bacteroidota bacterium]|nr:PspC domain-containing protein [Bacteroidota bacterium]